MASQRKRATHNLIIIGTKYEEHQSTKSSQKYKQYINLLLRVSP